MQKQVGISYMAVAITLLCSTSAQRPSFAGLRPTDGLNQKDKYHQTSDNANDITNRFGEADSPVFNTLAFGETQKPPVGYPVVSPLPVLAPLEDRFGSIDTTTPVHPAFHPHTLGPLGFGAPGLGPQGFNPSFFGGLQGGSTQGFIPQSFGSQGGSTQGFGTQSFGAQGINSQGLNPAAQGGATQSLSPQSFGAQGANSQGTNPQSFGTQGGGLLGLNPQSFGAQGGASQGTNQQFSGVQGGSSQGLNPQSFGVQGSTLQGLNPQGSQGATSQGTNQQSFGVQGGNSQGLNPLSFGAQGVNTQSNIAQTTIQPQIGQVSTSATSTNGGGTANAQPQRLPFDAHGDQLLIDQLNALPVDKRPFWFLNYQAIEAQRNSSTPFVGGLSPRGSFFG